MFSEAIGKSADSSFHAFSLSVLQNYTYSFGSQRKSKSFFAHSDH